MPEHCHTPGCESQLLPESELCPLSVSAGEVGTTGSSDTGVEDGATVASGISNSSLEDADVSFAASELDALDSDSASLMLEDGRTINSGRLLVGLATFVSSSSSVDWPLVGLTVFVDGAGVERVDVEEEEVEATHVEEEDQAEDEEVLSGAGSG